MIPDLAGRIVYAKDLLRQRKAAKKRQKHILEITFVARKI
jgi:hypothetical protein